MSKRMSLELNSGAMAQEPIDKSEGEEGKMVFPQPPKEYLANGHQISSRFKISTEPELDHSKTKYIRYDVTEPIDSSLDNPSIDNARMVDELSRLKQHDSDLFQDSLLIPQELYNRQIDESFRIRKLEKSLDDFSRQKQSKPC